MKPDNGSRGFLLVVLLWLWASPSLANRAEYGATPYPVWSPLTFFEREALSGLNKAQRGQADDLLALYLVASGVRDSADYLEVDKQLDDFHQQLNKLLTDDAQPLLIGELLNQQMHQRFFLKPSEQRPTGYAVDQSRLMGIFETGEFNCISSALLYAVLLRHHHIPASGVVLPSHAFIELNLADGRRVEVETTSPDGYDQVHDEAFYQRTNKAWFAARNLQPATFADYQQRQTISLLQLAARNMLNQHTADQHMSEQDSLRLAEISAFIDPTYPLAQEKRLYFYNREIQSLIIAQDWASLRRLFDTTYQTVLGDAARHVNIDLVQRAIQLYLSGAMLAYAQMGEIESTLQVMGELLNRDWSLSDSRSELERRVTNAVGVLLNHLVKQQQFDESQLVLSLTEAHVGNNQAWADMTRWLYFRWAEDHWQQKRWEEVVFTLKDFQNLSPVRDAKHPQELIESAYFNWVLELSEANDLDSAEGVVEQCRIQLTDQRLCQKAETLLRKQRQRQER